MKTHHLKVFLITAFIGFTGAAHASDNALGHTLGMGMSADWFDQANVQAGLDLAYRLDFGAGWAVGLELEGALGQEDRVAGFAAEDPRIVTGRLVGWMPMARRGPMDFQLRLGVGGQVASVSDESLADTTSTRFVMDVGPQVAIRLSDRVRLRTGLQLPVGLEVAPTTEISQMGGVIRAGVAVDLTDDLSMFVDAETGGTFGYGGDGFKSVLAGQVGLQYHLGGRVQTDVEADEDPLPIFVGLEWRGLGLGGHLSHGPGAEFGFHMLDGWLRLGINLYTRPGPLNPKEFTLDLEPGSTYNGQESLQVLGDGLFFGLFASLMMPVPSTENWFIELPVGVGQAGYGFYLQGDDRNTPDGRRVSDWEDQLMDGRDASIVIGFDVGARVVHRIDDWMEIYGGLHYAFLPGYDAFLKSSYDGPSISLGTRFGAF